MRWACCDVCHCKSPAGGPLTGIIEGLRITLILQAVGLGLPGQQGGDSNSKRVPRHWAKTIVTRKNVENEITGMSDVTSQDVGCKQ